MTLIEPEPAAIQADPNDLDTATGPTLRINGGSCQASQRDGQCHVSLSEGEPIAPTKVAWVLEWKLRILAGYQVYHHRGTWWLGNIPRVCVCCESRRQSEAVQCQSLLGKWDGIRQKGAGKHQERCL